MQQKKIGNSTEQELLQILREWGYWCHLMADKVNGQPCDIVAIRHNTGWLLDSKHCKGNRFDFKRIEANQQMCFEYNKLLGNTNTGFAIYFEKSNEWKLLRYDVYFRYLKDEYASIGVNDKLLENLCELQ